MTLEERREKGRERQRRWREANPDRVREVDRSYRAANREKIREGDRENHRRWREANPEKVREGSRRYYEANSDKTREKARRWQKANPEKRRVHRLRQSHDMSPEEWAALWVAQQGLCYLCDGPMKPEDAQLDHDHSCCPGKRSCRTCRRGLAHGDCNRLIGLAGDDPGRLARIAGNLRTAKKHAAERIATRPVQDTLLDIMRQHEREE